MRLFFITIFSSCFLAVGFAQEFDQRLLESYSQSELQEMKESNPEQLMLLEYALDNACYVTDLPEGKNPVLPSISLDLTEQFNFIALGLKIEPVNQYFKIDGENKMLVVKSTWVLNNEMNNQK